MSTLARGDQPRPSAGLQPPRFGLRALFWLVTALCICFAVTRVVGPVWAFTLGLLALLVAAHVVGNAVGMALRRTALGGQAPGPQGAIPPAPSAAVLRPPAAHHLQQRRPTFWSTLLGGGLGLLIGAATTGGMTAATYAPRITTAGILAAAVAGGVLGALFGALAAGFATNLGTSWREAAREAKRG